MVATENSISVGSPESSERSHDELQFSPISSRKEEPVELQPTSNPKSSRQQILDRIRSKLAKKTRAKVAKKPENLEFKLKNVDLKSVTKPDYQKEPVLIDDGLQSTIQDRQESQSLSQWQGVEQTRKTPDICTKLPSNVLLSQKDIGIYDIDRMDHTKTPENEVVQPIQPRLESQTQDLEST